ncbi:MAG: DNA polymerase III subunit delta [Armatimonadetes bacterium RBG_16_58_9]|nr:MAG: DNA polymerase III subunit delta [Armatimonadetes bacterium RBG_16_58_9]
MNARPREEANKRAYLLKGEDEFRKRQELDKLIGSLVAEDFADFDLEELDGSSATADRIMAGLNVPPFSSSQRVVLVKFANKMNEDEQRKLATALPKAPRTGCLIVVNPAPEKADGKVKKGSEVIGDLSRAIRKVGEVRSLPMMRPESARAFAKSLFVKSGKKIDERGLAHFVQRVGNDSSVIASEARKLIDYSGDSDAISAQDVATVTSETPEEKIFKLVDAIAARNQGQAVRLLSELFESGTNPDGDAARALAMIARHFRLLWQVKTLQESGIRNFTRDAVPDRIAAALPSSPNVLDVVARQGWMANRLSTQARSFTGGDLARCFAAISRADLMLKGITDDIEDPTVVMELLVLELSRKSPAR